MQFNDTTNLTGIIQLCENYCSLGRTGISGSSNLLKEFTAYANKTNRDVWSAIHEVYGGWQYDDSNETDLPSATATLTSDQATYALPSAALTVKGIEVKNENGDWTVVKPITLEKIREIQAENEFFETDGDPLYYTLTNSTVKLYPAPDYTQSASLRIFYDRGSHDFVSTDTTATPGFASEFHDIIPLGASLSYWLPKDAGNLVYQKLTLEYNRLMDNLKKYYSERWQELFPPKMKVRDYLKENR